MEIGCDCNAANDGHHPVASPVSNHSSSRATGSLAKISVLSAHDAGNRRLRRRRVADAVGDTRDDPLIIYQVVGRSLADHKCYAIA
jgi:hypothetical protein